MSWGKFNFVKIYDSKFKQDMGWYLKVTDRLTLVFYQDRIMNSTAREAVSIIGSLQKVSKGYGQGTVATAIEGMARIKGSLTGSICLGDIAKHQNDVFEVKAKILESEGCIYINKDQGFMTPLPCLEEGEKCVSTELIYPGDVIKLSISNWRGGSHYYISNNGVSLKIGGKTNWDLYSDALTAVDAYMEKEHPRVKFEIERKQTQCA